LEASELAEQKTRAALDRALMTSILEGMDVAQRCPICNATARAIADHPEATLHRCLRCTHCFSALKADHGEQYGLHYYEEEHKRWFENPNVGLFKRISDAILRDQKVHTVLDVGCGKGDFLRYVARVRPDLTLTGIELTDVPPTSGIRFIKGNVLTTPVEGIFDVVVSLAVIEHVSEVRAFARRLADLCRPGGLICVMTVNEASLLYDLVRGLRTIGFPLGFNRLYSGHHVHHFTARSLAELLQSEHLVRERAFMHNGLLAATDVPASSPLARGVLRAGVAGVMALGWFTGRMYLQTAVYRKPDDGPGS
jgi:cyclopropane fatty-acyl-phospholipid synthase-like methyltransferase